MNLNSLVFNETGYTVATQSSNSLPSIFFYSTESANAFDFILFVYSSAIDDRVFTVYFNSVESSFLINVVSYSRISKYWTFKSIWAECNSYVLFFTYLVIDSHVLMILNFTKK